MINLKALPGAAEHEIRDFILEALKSLVIAQDMLSEIADPEAPAGDARSAKVAEARASIEAAISATAYALYPNFDDMLRQAHESLGCTSERILSVLQSEGDLP
jgi:hypothetical protein